MVDRTDAPFLPPMLVTDEYGDYYTVEAQLATGVITFDILKNLLVQDEDGNFKTRASDAMAIMT